ncbi:MAG: F0F1 ATP synthase subunit gamma [Clostridia bacterium]
MKIKSVVKVMNFYSLLRVDSSKKKAEKYFGYEQAVKEFIDNILNNKNLILDKKMIKMNDKGKELNIYIANDLGFCGSFNSNINELLRKDKENDKIIIGKKIVQDKKYDNVIVSMSKDEYLEKALAINKIMFDSIRDKKYKSINLIYNHYYNVSRIERVKQQILPLEKTKKNKEEYQDDFAVEGNINSILLNIITLYLGYEVKVAVENSYASENIMRQMITKESLKKIDEMEAEKKLTNRKKRQMKSLKKQLDNINKMNLNK